jgi:hypothetical protein
LGGLLCNSLIDGSMVGLNCWTRVFALSPCSFARKRERQRLFLLWRWAAWRPGLPLASFVAHDSPSSTPSEHSVFLSRGKKIAHCCVRRRIILNKKLIDSISIVYFTCEWTRRVTKLDWISSKRKSSGESKETKATQQ